MRIFKEYNDSVTIEIKDFNIRFCYLYNVMKSKRKLGSRRLLKTVFRGVVEIERSEVNAYIYEQGERRSLEFYFSKIFG